MDGISSVASVQDARGAGYPVGSARTDAESAAATKQAGNASEKARRTESLPTDEVVQNMQEDLEMTNLSVGFTTYGDKKKTAVVVSNRDTGDVIREIPPKEIQKLQTRMEELSGVILNQMA